jgi:hypothetical protein
MLYIDRAIWNPCKKGNDAYMNVFCHSVDISTSRVCVLVFSEPAPSAMTALQAFGAEMLRLSRGFEAAGNRQGHQNRGNAPPTPPLQAPPVDCTPMG